jgi:fructokinase
MCKIICVGEILWDALPEGLFLGGAPFNVAAHLNMLGQDVVFASRVGSDDLGIEIIRQVSRIGLDNRYIQIDEVQPTGFVKVVLDENKNASYDILKPAAWDFLELKPELLTSMQGARAIVFGSLAQRAEETRNTIRALLYSNTLAVFDVNLRPPFDDKEIVEESLYLADLVKLNEDELVQLQDWFEISGSMQQAANNLKEKFNCQAICITRGHNGAVLLNNTTWLEHPGYKVDVCDTVGSGDSFLAALLHGFFSGREGNDLLNFANAVGAYVATQQGAIPDLDMEKINTIQNL